MHQPTDAHPGPYGLHRGIALALVAATAAAFAADALHAASLPSATARSVQRPQAQPAAAPREVATMEHHMQRTTNEAGGFSIAHDPAWQVRSEGASTVVMPSADPATLEYYGVSAVAWSSSKPLLIAANAEEAARLLLADAPLLKRDGSIERVKLSRARESAAATSRGGTTVDATGGTSTAASEEASRSPETAPRRDASDGDAASPKVAKEPATSQAEGSPKEIDAILIRASAQGQGTTVRVVVLARILGESLVGLVAFGDDHTIAARESRARALFASIEPTPSAQATGGVAVRVGVVEAADLAFVGRWKTEEVLASGGGFDFGGQASMVTERVLELGRDGRFALGARSAGGGAGAVFEGGFRVDARGSWRVERTGEVAYLVMTADGAAPERVRCAIHEGKLVVGEPGARKFFDRAE